MPIKPSCKELRPLDSIPARAFETYVYNRETGEYLTGHNAPRVYIDRSKVFIEGHQVSKPITKGSTLYWHDAKPGLATYGHLSFDKSRSGFVGQIGIGSDAANLDINSVVGGVPPSRFKTKLSKNENMWNDKEKKCNASGSEFNDGPEVEIGFIVVNNKLVNTLKMIINGDTIDFHESEIAMTCISDPKTHELTFSFGNDAAATEALKYPLQFPYKAEFTISYDFQSFKGYANLGTADGSLSDKHCWNGTLQPQETPSHVLSAMAQSKPDFVEQDLSTSGDLSIMALFALCTKPDNIQKISQNILVELMKAKMSSDTLKDIFGENPPILDPPEQAIANHEGASKFYSDFSMAFIGQAFGTKPPDDAAKLTDAERLKIKYYLQNTMPKKPEYTDQSNACYLQAFLQLQPDLKGYLDDQANNHPEDKCYWATQLYNYLISQAQINNIATRIGFHTKDGMLLVRTFSDVLHILQPGNVDPKDLLAVKYTKKIYTEILLSQSFNDTDFVDDESKERVQEVMVSYINAILAGTIPEATEAVQQAQEALNPIVKALGGPQNWIGEFLNLMAAKKLNPLQKMGKLQKFTRVTSAVEEFFKKHPTLNKVQFGFQKVMYGAVLVGGIAVTIYCLTNGKLDTIQKIGAITQLFYLGLQLTKDLAEFTKWVATKVTAKTTQALQSAESLDRVEGAVSSAASETGEQGERLLAESVGECFEKESGTFVNKLGTWAGKLFTGLETAMKIAGPIVSLVNTVMVGDQLVKDIKDGASAALLAMDGIQLACGILETCCLTIELLLPELATFAGPLAIVFAVVGLIAGIVNIFLPHPTPADIFVKNQLQPWLQNQDDPPKGWTGSNN